MVTLSKQKIRLSEIIYNCIDIPTEELNRDIAFKIKNPEISEETKASKYKRPHKHHCIILLNQNNNFVLLSQFTVTAEDLPLGLWSSVKMTYAKWNGSIGSALKRKIWEKSGFVRNVRSIVGKTTGKLDLDTDLKKILLLYLPMIYNFDRYPKIIKKNPKYLADLMEIAVFVYS